MKLGNFILTDSDICRCEDLPGEYLEEEEYFHIKQNSGSRYFFILYISLFLSFFCAAKQHQLVAVCVDLLGPKIGDMARLDDDEDRRVSPLW